MATTNPTISDAWTLLVTDTGQDFFLSLPFETPHRVEVATWGSADAPPSTLTGHLLNAAKRESVNRSLLGDGCLFARCLSGSTAVVLNTWTNSILLFDAGLWATSATWLIDRTWG